jgi:hypothetical protein
MLLPCFGRLGAVNIIRRNLDMGEPLRHGPRAGSQDYVKYCPNCKGDLRSIASRNRPPEESHSYQCDTCGRVFEINELGQD